VPGSPGKLSYQQLSYEQLSDERLNSKERKLTRRYHCVSALGDYPAARVVEFRQHAYWFCRIRLIWLEQSKAERFTGHHSDEVVVPTAA
jgi:hypothetical protein